MKKFLVILLLFTLFKSNAQNPREPVKGTGALKVMCQIDTSGHIPLSNVDALLFVDSLGPQKIKIDADGYFFTRIPMGKHIIRVQTDKYCAFEITELQILEYKTTYASWKLRMKKRSDDKCITSEKYDPPRIDPSTAWGMARVSQDEFPKNPFQKTYWEKLSDGEKKKMVEKYYKKKN